MRFRAESHLRRPGDFARVRDQGRRFHCGGFVLWAAPQPATQPLAGSETEAGHGAGVISPAAEPAAKIPGTVHRVGFVASRSAVGGAVQRNRAKRRLREVFRQHQDHVPPGVDLVFVARRALNGLEYGEIERNFLKACAQLFSVPPHR